MIPVKKAKIGCFTYDIILSKAKQMSSHGETNIDTKQIIVYPNGNEDVVKETLQHEILHALLEDIIPTIKEIESEDKMEEQLIRLLSPRLMSFVLDNPKLAKYIWNL